MVHSDNDNRAGTETPSGFEIKAADIEFLSQIGDVYGRNNRSNGQKNLRCFPVCSSIHSDIGFCGTPLPVNFKLLWYGLHQYVSLT